MGEQNGHLKGEVLKLLNEYRDIIALNDEKPGITSIMKHKIIVEDENPV